MSDEIIESDDQMTREIVTFHGPDDLAVMPVIDLAMAEQRYRQMVEFVNKIMRPDVDYGTIPGTAKPTLYKPGAEKLATFFGLRKTFVLQDKIEDWDEKDPLFFYRYKSQLWRGDWLIAEGIGSASSKEDRYRWRWVPEEKVPANLDPKDLQSRGGKISEFEFAIKDARTEGDYAKPQEYWDKFKAAIADGTAKSILKQAKSGKEYDAWEIDASYYRIPNPDVFTVVNTIDKMAQKRAFIQAVLIGVNASEFFTQDVEDLPSEVLSGVEDKYTPPPQYVEELKKEPKSENRPYPPAIAREKILGIVDKFKGIRKDEKKGDMTLAQFVAWQMNECFPGPDSDKKRHSLLNYIFGVDSVNDLTGAQLKALEKWLGSKSEGPGAGFLPSKEARLEAATMFTTYLKEKGQEELPI